MGVTFQVHVTVGTMPSLARVGGCRFSSDRNSSGSMTRLPCKDNSYLILTSKIPPVYCFISRNIMSKLSKPLNHFWDTKCHLNSHLDPAEDLLGSHPVKLCERRPQLVLEGRLSGFHNSLSCYVHGILKTCLPRFCLTLYYADKMIALENFAISSNYQITTRISIY